MTSKDQGLYTKTWARHYGNGSYRVTHVLCYDCLDALGQCKDQVVNGFIFFQSV